MRTFDTFPMPPKASATLMVFNIWSDEARAAAAEARKSSHEAHASTHEAQDIENKSDKSISREDKDALHTDAAHAHLQARDKNNAAAKATGDHSFSIKANHHQSMADYHISKGGSDFGY